MTEPRTAEGTPPPRVRAAIGALTVVVGFLAVAGWQAQRGGAPAVTPMHLHPAVLALLFAACEAVVVRFHFRGETQNASLSEVPLAIGLVFTGPAGLIIARALGPAAVFLARRQPPLKLAFNVATGALEASVAVVVFRQLLGTASPASPQGWLAMAVAVTAGGLASHAAVLAAIHLASGPLHARAVRLALATAVCIAVLNAALAVQAVLVLWVDPRAAFALAVSAAGLAVGQRAHTALRRRYGRLDTLYAFTEALELRSEHRPMTDVVLAETAELLRARRTELMLPGPGGTNVFLVFDAATGLAAGTPWAPDKGHSEALARMRPVLSSRHRTADTALAPFLTSTGEPGLLVATDRLRETTTFDAEDLKLFQALANHAGVALDNCALVDRLVAEAVELAYKASHDGLTGLLNRSRFVQDVASSGDGVEAAVCVVNLDGFTEVNDTLGHRAGDVVLREVAARLSSAMADDVIVARLGGDEFGIAKVGDHGTDAVRQLATEIRSTIERPVIVEGLPFDVRGSIGTSHGLVRAEADVDDLLRRADVAMHQAKRAGIGIAPYQAGHDPHTTDRLALLAELRTAIFDGGLVLQYQPKVDIVSGRVVGVEALARWPHPKRGFVPPDEFIPLAERAGLIPALTSWVLRSALTQLAAWHAQGWTGLTMAVNISARSLADDRLVTEVAGLLDELSVPPRALVLELTESTLMAEVQGGQEQAVRALAQLASEGVALSVDDFGTGYSSLAQLKRLPFAEVKIDRSFVRSLCSDPDDAAIVLLVVELARSLDLRVVAEGVEDEATAQRLISLGCRIVQGYHLSRPLSPCALQEWLEGSGYHARAEPAVPSVRRLQAVRMSG